MPRITSQIAEEYANALDKAGLLKTAYPSLEKYQDDTEARVGSDDISTVEALYGIKPDSIDQMDYENSIMEIAHPNSVIIAPSYDKINGLVENNIERSNIMNNIALKPTEGNNTNPKYAYQELVSELVKVANEMDSKNHAELFALADECLIQLYKEAISLEDIKQWFKQQGRDLPQIGEGAITGAGIGAGIGALVSVWAGPLMLPSIATGAATGAAVGGIAAAFFKTAPQVKNVSLNAKELQDQLKDLISKIPEDKTFFENINVAVDALVKSSTKYQELISTLKDKVLHGDVKDTDQKAVADAAKQFLDYTAVIKHLHQDFDTRNKAGEFAKATPSKMMKPIYWFISDDIEDVSEAFDSLEDAIEKLMEATKSNVSSAISNPTPPSAQSQAPGSASQVLDWASSLMKE